MRRIGAGMVVLGMVMCVGGLSDPASADSKKMMETAGTLWAYGVMVALGGWVAGWFVD